MTRLFVNTYTDANPERNAELVYCLAENKKVFDEVVEIEGRPTYMEYFSMINAVAKQGDISVIANLDIVIDEENLKLIEKNLRNDECYALSRWDKIGDRAIHFDRWDSQDFWAFNGKVKSVDRCEIRQAVAGIDNAIAERLNAAGYIVLNPSKDIKTIHHHETGVRNYNPKEKTARPYLLVTPHHLGEYPQYRKILQGQ